jgi:hypothetical protein
MPIGRPYLEAKREARRGGIGLTMLSNVSESKKVFV